MIAGGIGLERADDADRSDTSVKAWPSGAVAMRCAVTIARRCSGSRPQGGQTVAC